MSNSFKFKFGTLKDGKWQGDGDKMYREHIRSDWVVFLAIDKGNCHWATGINDKGVINDCYDLKDNWKLWSPPKLEWDFTKKIIYGVHEKYITMYEQLREPGWWMKYMKHESMGIITVRLISTESIKDLCKPIEDQGWI